MEPMDIDFVVDVPDTPDRQAVGRKDKSIQSGNDDKVRTGLRVNENGSRKPLLQAPRSCRSSLSDHGSSSAAAPGNSFSKTCVPLRRLGSNNVPSYENGYGQSAKNNKLQNNVSSVDQEGSVENLTARNGYSKKGKKVVLRGQLGGSQAVVNGTNSTQVVELHSPRSMRDSLVTSRMNYGTEQFNTVSSFDHSKGVVSSAVIQPNAGRSLSASPDSGSSSSRVIGQKRWVRNGCISPSNIAKVQHTFGNGKNSAVDDEQRHPLSFSSTGSLAGEHARVPVLSNVSKGKEVIMHPLSMKESGGQDETNRDAVSINEIVEDIDDNRGTFRSPGHLGGWRSTRNRSKTLNLTSSKERNHSSSSSESPPLPPLNQRLHSVRSQLNQHNGDNPVANMIQKRQKQGSSSNIQDDLSGSTSDDSGIIFLGSPGNTIESRPARLHRRNRVDTSKGVIEIDEGSSGIRGDGYNGTGSSNSEIAMARQIEADERLAWELQEQLYNEDGVRVGEIDPQETLDLPHENLQHGFPRRSRHGLSVRNTLTANSSRLPRVRSSVNASRTSPQAGASIHTRMDRLRNRFPGRPRTLSSSRERSSMFSSEMDVDLRMSILEALEAFNDMGVDNNFLEINREFNENDYEMLLALDENNNRHSGASTSRINHLPQSTVQNDNFEDDCAVCLETPSTGDIIRHLPCLHKFHKDCIDPWLRRKSSCPVCKSSIT